MNDLAAMILWGFAMLQSYHVAARYDDKGEQNKVLGWMVFHCICIFLMGLNFVQFIWRS